MDNHEKSYLDRHSSGALLEVKITLVTFPARSAQMSNEAVGERKKYEATAADELCSIHIAPSRL